MTHPTALRQVAPQDPGRPLDEDQAAVVDHRGGVALVLGAPGTGRTTTLVEHVRARILGGLPADGCLALAPTRAGAARLRTRIGAGLEATHTEPLARTPSSLAFAVLRLAAARDGEPMPRLISGAEQDAVLRELLAGHRADGTGPVWPGELEPALTTSGFRDQLRDLLMRAVERGMEPDDLVELGRRHERPEWGAAAEVLAEYDQVTALSDPGSYDPAWICGAAADRLEDDEDLRAVVQGRLRLLVVDDAQELTVSAGRLLSALRPVGADTLLAGDPDATALAFRGAVPGLFLDLARQWSADDRDARVGDSSGSPRRLVLGARHGVGAEVAAAVDRVAARIGVVGTAAHRQPRAPEPGTRPAPSSAVLVDVARSPAQEAAHIARWMRRAHLIDGLPWSSMAVIARSGAQQETLRRALTAGGVPVHLDRSGLPLAQDPAVRPLLTALDVVTRSGGASPDAAVAGPSWSLTPEEAVELLTGPLAGVEPVALRRLRRRLRAAELAAGGDRRADELLAATVQDESWRRAVPNDVDPDLIPAVRLGRILDAGAVAHRGGPRGLSGSAEDVLWALWDATGLAEVWADQALAGGPLGARADRDLDAVLVLFGAAERYVERLPAAGARGFLDHIRAEQVAADTLVTGASSPEMVEVLTPQAAAGRRWDLVAVAGVQDGVWPDLRLRDGLLGAEALVEAWEGRPVHGVEALRAAQDRVRNDELRQFHVAVSRARLALMVTATASVDEQPSGLLDLIDPAYRDRPPVDVPPPLTLRGLVGELRRAAVRSHREGDVATRDRAVELLALLAAEGVPGADPSGWWQAREASSSNPVRADATVRVSPSRVQTWNDCPLRWFLTSRGAETGEVGAADVGTLVHAVIAEAPDADAATLSAQIARRWPELGLPEGWVNERGLRQARLMVERYAAYADRARAAGRELVGVELPLSVQLQAEDGPPVALVGTVDRLEQDADGRLVVVDLKTGRTPPSKAEVAQHAQLGAYQVAVEEGAFRSGTGSQVSGGAMLVQLGRPGDNVDAKTEQTQPALAAAEDPGWARDLVLAAGRGMGGARFEARDLERRCRTCPARFSCPLQPEGGSR